MVKFSLMIWVCSFLGQGGACLPPIKHPIQFDSWYKCSRVAHQESIKIYSKLGYKVVNEARLATRYTCTANSSI